MTAEKNISELLQNCEAGKYISDPALHDSLIQLLQLSDYAKSLLKNRPELIADCCSQSLQTTLNKQALQEHYFSGLDYSVDEDSFMQSLRLLKQQFFFRWMWRELAAADDYPKLMRELSNFADLAIVAAKEYAEHQLAQTFGQPQFNGLPISLTIIAMGKLGEEAVNFSSDVDLIFSFAGDGSTDNENRSISNEEFFLRVARKMVQYLDAKTFDGFVFRVDLRLRPFGNSGPIVVNFSALENYYQVHGRTWERYAWIKARVIEPNSATRKLISSLRPFVFRRYVDYGIFSELREMKAKILANLSTKNYHYDIKRGSGGIRQVEFIIQSLQLLRGGKEPALQSRPSLTIINRLAKRGYLAASVAAHLFEAYLFLRKLENHLQMRQEKQTHQLPSKEQELQRIAVSMGFAEPEALMNQLKAHQLRIANVFDHLSAIPELASSDADDQSAWQDLWQGRLATKAAIELLHQNNFHNPEEILNKIQAFTKSAKYTSRSANTINRFKQLMPLIISSCSLQPNADQCFERVFEVVISIAKRSAYLALLYEREDARQSLVNLCSKSIYLARQLATHPALLDEWLHPEKLYSPLDEASLTEELSYRLKWQDSESLETNIECLCQFKYANIFKLASKELESLISSQEVANSLTVIAKIILEHIYKFALVQLDPKLVVDELPFLIVAYGTLGANDLSYESDLDLIFLFSETEMQQVVPDVPAMEFSLKLAQKILYMLQTLTVSGKLYSVDTRLRPSGNAGLLVSDINSFRDYQVKDAWTYEHQAIIKARPIVGAHNLSTQFNEIRQQIIGLERTDIKLKQDIRSMYDKLKSLRIIPDKHDVKNLVKSSMLSIDFIIQYYCLAYGSKYKELAVSQDPYQIISSLTTHKILPATDANYLQEMLSLLQFYSHQLALQVQLDFSATDTPKQILANLQNLLAKIFKE